VLLAAAPPKLKAPETFLVEDRGLAFLAPDGREVGRLWPYSTWGALSPDGRLLACTELTGTHPGGLVIRDRGGRGHATAVPVNRGPSDILMPLWSADGRRLLVGRYRPAIAPNRTKVGYSCEVYDLGTKKVTPLKLSGRHWVTGWSRDGRRLLTTNRAWGAVAWADADGTGKPEYITPDDEYALDGRLSPNGRRLLYPARPRDSERPDSEWRLWVLHLGTGKRAAVSGPGGRAFGYGWSPEGGRVAYVRQGRLWVVDLAGGKRVALSEPGGAISYCWSPDGRRVAYTWQGPTGKGEAAEPEAILFTCDPDGRNRKKVTSRKHKRTKGDPGVITFFAVLDWR
jgi:Tol biopolymer transport system component